MASCVPGSAVARSAIRWNLQQGSENVCERSGSVKLAARTVGLASRRRLTCDGTRRHGELHLDKHRWMIVHTETRAEDERRRRVEIRREVEGPDVEQHPSSSV